MGKRFMIITEKYDGLIKKAVNMLSGEVSARLCYVLPVKPASRVSREELAKNSIIVVGSPSENKILAECKNRGFLSESTGKEGYSIYVGRSIYNSEADMVLISGDEDVGVLYGCVDFCNKYCGDVLYKDSYIWENNFFKTPFERGLNGWKLSSAPAVKTRAIWTWGHVIYDYRKFFDNMLRLKLNEIVIWNDFLPLNARDVVKYAHSLGIKVIWGFAWGWTTNCEKFIQELTEESFEKIKSSVLEKYENEYADTGADGIYFQSFTELSGERVGSVSVAEAVTKLVNDISAALLAKAPNLHIQFGLHASSVKTQLDAIKGVDKRIYIVWEDCGAFPYNYYTDKTDGFEDTLALTKQLCSLRQENESFGAVLKGMLNLDWHSFEHFSDSYILGERPESYIRERQADKNKIWKIIQAGWLKNAEFARKTISTISKECDNAIVEALVEDGMFENKIMLPVAMFAEMLWTPERPVGELIEEVAKYPCVHFANV